MGSLDHMLREVDNCGFSQASYSHMIGQNNVIALFADLMRFPNRGASNSDLVTTNGTANGTTDIEAKYSRTPLPDNYVYSALLLGQRGITSWKGPLVGEHAKESSLDITAEFKPRYAHFWSFKMPRVLPQFMFTPLIQLFPHRNLQLA